VVKEPSCSQMILSYVRASPNTSSPVLTTAQRPFQAHALALWNQGPSPAIEGQVCQTSESYRPATLAT
jgi:hypothetical protein